ncbi:MAG: AAA family ATPase [Desulfurellaceae bacterium]|nr:AAA family ATPase [Desulfurellaceae bacterium]
MELPEDICFIPLKYGANCRSCKANLKVGERAYWSPSAKKVWCARCVSGKNPPVQSAADRRAEKSQSAASNTNPNPARVRKLPVDNPQALWQRLCEYARRCIEAEAAKSLVPYNKEGSLWFSYSGEDKLVVGEGDSTPASRKLADRLGSRTGSQDGRSIIYGWPTVVVIERNHMPKVAPLFAVSVDPEQDSNGEWILHAKTEPEFNLAVTASGIFDPSINEEVADLLDHGLPFGDPVSFAALVEQTAEVLGLDILSHRLDPKILDPSLGRKQGVYNAAVSVLAESSSYHTAICEELRQLETRKDWSATAAAYLLPDDSAPKEDLQPPAGPLAAPLLCNQSQEETLERLRRAPLTIVTGPPGTGKTQLVVNAVTNAWLDGDKVLVTSTNNAAVDVAAKRAADDICRGLLIRTGNRSARENIADLITAASAQATKYADGQATTRAQLKRSATERTQLMEKLARLDELDKELLSVAEKLEENRLALKEAAQTLWSDASPPELAISSSRTEQRARRLLRAWFFRRFRTQHLRKQLGCIETAPLEQIITWARTDQSRLKLTSQLEIRRTERRQLEATVGDPTVSVQQANRKWAEASLSAIRSETAARIRSSANQLADFGRMSARGGQVKRAIGNSLASLRGWACTALSAGSNFPLESGLFDLVIVDEASQCSLASVLPLAYRAKRLTLVGDPSQLPPIVSLSDQLLQDIATQAGFKNDKLREQGIHHKNGSAYFAFKFAARPQAPLLLNEHYRCHPHIARWFNRTFYKNELNVLTEVNEIAQCDRAICWRDIEGVAERPPAGQSWLNRAEAEQSVEQLGELLCSFSTVGVLTPFAAQAQLIEQLAKERFDRSILKEKEFVCGTAHSLQGNERDAILISCVLSPGMSENSAFWVEKERNLLNVAVSRARRALIALGHPAMSDLGNPTLASLRAYLRDEIPQNGGSAEPFAEFRTDSRSEELLLDAMQLRDLAPYAKLNVEGYELDFALLEQGIKLNIEVDGDQHLDARGRQRRQDITRDRVISKLGWTVLRIPAWRCHEEIDSVIDEIEKTRDRLLVETSRRTLS